MTLLRPVILALLNILTLFIAAPLCAEEATIDQIIAMAQGNNPAITAADAKVTAARAAARSAKGKRLPTLDVVTGVQRSDAPLDAFGSLLQQRAVTQADFAPNRINNPGFVTNYHSQATLALPLYHGGAITGAIDQREAALRARQARLRATRQSITMQTIQAFIAAKSSSAEITARKQEIAAARQRLHDIIQLQRQGMALDSDTMDAKAHLLQSELALTHSRNSYADSIDRLRRLTGNATLTIRGDLHLRSITGSMQSWVEAALKQRDDLQALLAQREAITHQRAMARAGFLPNVDLVASQQWNSGTLGLSNRSSAIGATVSINLFHGGSDRAQLAAAEAEIAAIDATIADRRAAITSEVQRRWRAWQEAQLRLESARQLRKQRQEALRIRKLRHQQGLETSSELLRTQVANDVAQVATIRARYGLMQATALLYASAGKLTPEVIQ